MRIGRDDFFHLTYCTNIHPGESWEEVAAALKTHLPPLKAQLAPERPFGVGLRLSDRAARELLQDDRLTRFKAWLDEQGLYVFTLNGFPYGGFHDQVVKDQVHAPDWRTPERMRYTIRLARILAELLPEDLDGSISTSPVSYKPWLEEAERGEACRVGSRHLAEVAGELVRLRERTGKHLHVDLEPEPDGLIENTTETVGFFTQWLRPVGGAHLADELGIAQEKAEAHLRKHIGVCYDTCHFAVEYEEPAAVFDQLEEAQIRVGKIQISAALKIALPETTEGRQVAAERLQPFAEDTYLHQVIGRRADGSHVSYLDLPEALGHIAQDETQEWRIHYHVPIFVGDYDALQSTQRDIVAALEEGRQRRSCAPLEIETYTWEVLPPELKQDLTDSIRREYEWMLSVFEA